MLAAPIVNPVVVASTYVAYRGRDTVAIMVLGRLALGFIVAMAVGWVLGAVRGDQLLKQRDAEVEAHEVDAAEHRWRRFFGHLTGDIVFMARFLILGAAIAAAVQTFIPQSFLNGVANLPILSLIAMMALAFIMSLCSESDAFVAASFTGVRPGPATGLPGVRAHGRPEAGRPLRRHVRARVLPDGGDRRRRHDAGGDLVDPGVLRMKRHWSPARVGAGLVIGAWAALFWFVWAAGRTSLYLSTRTAWLIPMGAILMTVAAVGRLASARVERTEHLGSRETVMFGVIALPVVL